jgi:hypothetical protein
MFDPYRKWLGIPEGQRPPTHYQLLGISPDERDTEVIDAAVLRQSAYVRNFQTGKYSAEATRLLTEIAAAKLCLIDPAKRASYDAELRANGPAPGGTASVASPPSERTPAPTPATIAPKNGPRRPATQKPAVRAAAASAPAARPQAAPRRPMPASRSYAAGGLQPWAVEPPALGNFASSRPAASNNRPIWIGLGIGACCVPFLLTAVVLMSRPADPSVAAADGQSGPAANAPVDVNAFSAAPPTGSATIPPVGPLIQTVPPVIVEESPATNDAKRRASQNVPPADGGEIEQERSQPTPEAPADDSSLEMPEGAREFIDRMEREADQRRRELEARTDRSSDSLNPFGKKSEEGVDTMFIGHDGGGSQRTVKPGSHMIGLAYRLGEWGREKCVAEIKPIFSLDETATLPLWETAREGYAVGAAKVRTYNYVNAIRLTYMRIKADGRLDPADFYKGDWLGFRGGKEFEITGDGDPIIGIHARQGLILDAVALVVDRKSSKSKSRTKASQKSD